MGSLSTPRSHRLSSPLLLPGSRSSTAASWAPPGVGGSRGPASAPFPPRPRGRRAPDAGLSTRGQTTPPTDGRVSRLPAAGIPRVGGGRAALRGGEEEGAEKEEGEETDHSRKRRQH